MSCTKSDTKAHTHSKACQHLQACIIAIQYPILDSKATLQMHYCCTPWAVNLLWQILSIKSPRYFLFLLCKQAFTGLHYRIGISLDFENKIAYPPMSSCLDLVFLCVAVKRQRKTFLLKCVAVMRYLWRTQTPEASNTSRRGLPWSTCVRMVAYFRA